MVQYRDAKTGRFISVETHAKIQLRLERIAKAAERARAGSLHAVGYLVSLAAKAKIKRSKTASSPGQPPATRRGLLKRAIRYKVTDDRKSVVIGPRYSVVGTAGEAHEYGGRYMGEKFPKRPFMGPAMKEVAPKIGPTYKIS